MRRSTRRMALTEAGVELLSRARRLLRDLEEARDAVRPSKTATGRLVVSAPVSFGLAQVAPLVTKLLEQNPKLCLELRFDDRVVDLVEDGIDLALRTGVAPPDSAFIVARPLATYERVLCATPQFIKKHGPLDDVEALALVPCVLLGAGPTTWQLGTIDGPKSVTVSGRISSNNVLALRGAALGGLGVAQLPRWLVAEDLKARRLARVLDSAVLPTVTVLGLVHADARRSNALRLVQDFLAAEFPAALAQRAMPRTPGTGARTR